MNRRTNLINVPLRRVDSINIPFLFDSHCRPFAVGERRAAVNGFTRGVKPERRIYLYSRLVSGDIDSATDGM